MEHEEQRPNHGVVALELQFGTLRYAYFRRASAEYLHITRIALNITKGVMNSTNHPYRS